MTGMRRSAVVVALLVSLALPGLARADVAVGDRAAELVQVVSSKGKRLSLKALRDRVVVMTFGASWCEPCKRELPAFEKLAAGYAGRRAKVTFLAINIDNDRAKGKVFVRQAGLKHVVAGFDTAKSTVDSYDPPKMPTTFIIRGGIIRHIHAGFSAGDDLKVAAAIDGELGKL